MTLQNSITFWIKSSSDDFKTAKAMYNANRYNYTIFMCQQSLEELLKAVIMIQTKDNPPYIHDLIMLSRRLDLQIPEYIFETLRNINPHYIAARYKPQRFDYRIYNRNSARKAVASTEEVIKWFVQEMDLKKYLPNL